METIAFPLFADRQLHVAYFRNVQNSGALREALTNQDVDAALLNASRVVNLLQVQAAAARALLCEQDERMTTKGVHSEIVFNVSGSRNVNESFRRFGLSDDSTELLLCIMDSDKDSVERVLAKVQGTLTPVSEIGTHLTDEDVKQIRKYYKVQDLELECSSLTEAIVCRIATKSCSK